ncbi:Family A G protein-coupled receptor-like protein [Glarea lozoyensis ATCC 20868]|uniref:Family A G protein-coupled receptor-like protein n=1 Tax=Glarea lozoyensis (strain ATCC 20868 / MF5171) TaxID=1116229 RepID=S3CGI0_GLAL2|nr:Family A G protein-coupled receptor-like protein [Glarea lozoyensis ATCC 20868]EPE24359.1 Family A G protein-coupled receptor-like protein [Glarea lozoyensis ATCC 20868]
MAPHSPSFLDHVYPRMEMEIRDLGRNTSGNASTPTSEQRNTLQVLALTFSAISVASSVIAFYWFVKMRRTFRHDLIMLLIQSDMFKALWFMIYPIVVFSQGPVMSDSRFCQVNGFFLSVGIEASDFAILQIAIHTALYIFKPKAKGGEGGLYPYRYIAYFCWLFFPLLMASLAFINDHDSYVVEGTYCYLPVRPFWYRLALSWIPRYIIFIVILFIYASIYFYVRYKFHGFTNSSERPDANNPDSVDSAEAGRKPVKRHTLPPTPTLACHGLIPVSRQVSMNEAPTRDLNTTMDSYTFSDTGLRRGSASHRFMWQSFVAKSTPVDGSAPSTTPDSGTEPPSPQVAPVPESSVENTIPRSLRDNMSLDSANQTPLRSHTSWKEFFARRFSPDVSGQPSVVGMMSALRRGPDGVSDVPTPISQLQLVNSRGQNLADVEMDRTRNKIRRQLRFLFIYPLVYMGMWVVPFISHVLQYSDRFATDPPFGLVCVTTVFVCSQAAIDCWLFSTREKPWKHMPGHDGTFWGSFGLASEWKPSDGRTNSHGPGKTRQEMSREARDAYHRRDEELAERRGGATVIQRPEATAHPSISQRGGSHWWDRPGLDGSVDMGGMSPVIEESNPIEGSPCQGSETSSEEVAGSVEKTTSGSSGTTASGGLSPNFRTVTFREGGNVS